VTYLGLNCNLRIQTNANAKLYRQSHSTWLIWYQMSQVLWLARRIRLTLQLDLQSLNIPQLSKLRGWRYRGEWTEECWSIWLSQVIFVLKNHTYWCKVHVGCVFYLNIILSIFSSYIHNYLPRLNQKFVRQYLRRMFEFSWLQTGLMDITWQNLADQVALSNPYMTPPQISCFDLSYSPYW